MRNRSRAISRFVRPTATQPHDLALAARQAGAVGVGLRAHAEPLGDRLAERGDLARRRGGQRPGAELARGAVGARRAARAPTLALAGGGERDAGAQLDLRALERHVEVAVQLDGAA